MIPALMPNKRYFGINKTSFPNCRQFVSSFTRHWSRVTRVNKKRRLGKRNRTWPTALSGIATAARTPSFFTPTDNELPGFVLGLGLAYPICMRFTGATANNYNTKLTAIWLDSIQN